MRPHRGEAHEDVRFHRVSDRITVALAPVVGERVLANATIVVGDRTTVVIDTMISPAMVEPVRHEAERLGGRPVRWVFLTHADPDHVLGLPSFPDATVIAAERAYEALQVPAVRERYAGIHASGGGDAASFEMPRVDVAFAERARLDLGGIHLEAIVVGHAHSPADTIVWCPQERVAWSGDLVFHGVFPLMRDELDRWYVGLERLSAWQPEVVVPGHGLVAGPDVLAAQFRVLKAVEAEATALYRAGVPVEEAAQRARVEAYGDLPLAGERLPEAVRQVYGILDRREGDSEPT